MGLLKEDVDMLDILIRAGSFVTIIFLGWGLRKIGVFRKEDFSVLSAIVLKITLPAAVIASTAGKALDPSLLVITAIGIGCGILYMLLGYLMSIGASRGEKAFSLLNMSGYNLGNFTIPFVQSFLGPGAMVTASLFDTGNAVICLGGAYSVAAMVKDGNGFSLARVGKLLLRSVPFCCYVLMTMLNLCRIGVPGPVVSLAQIIGDANAFLAMLMIGVGFQMQGDRGQIGKIAKVLVLRFGVAAILGAAIYFLLPFSLEIRQTLTILVCSPIGSAVPAFTEDLEEDVGLSSAINSISIVCSIVIIVTLLSVML